MMETEVKLEVGYRAIVKTLLMMPGIFLEDL